MTSSVSLRTLAEELGMDKSALRRAALKLGITPHRVRTRASRGQATLAVTPEEAKTIRQHYAWRIAK